jgi:hypothetical protein
MIILKYDLNFKSHFSHTEQRIENTDVIILCRFVLCQQHVIAQLSIAYLLKKEFKKIQEVTIGNGCSLTS